METSISTILAFISVAQNCGSAGSMTRWPQLFKMASVLCHHLVGGLEHLDHFSILGIIIPTDSYFSEGLKPPVQYCVTSGSRHSLFVKASGNPLPRISGRGQLLPTGTSAPCWWVWAQSLPSAQSEVRGWDGRCMVGLGPKSIWVNYNDLTATEPWNHGFYREIIPKWPNYSG